MRDGMYGNGQESRPTFEWSYIMIQTNFIIKRYPRCRRDLLSTAPALLDDLLWRTGFTSQQAPQYVF
jgi:hypothetical protein